VTWTPVGGGVTGRDGTASYEFPAPGNKAGWVWVRAFTKVGEADVAVGGPQAKPAASQTTLAAEFAAGPVSAASSSAAFETYPATVLNNLAARSWARLSLLDDYGNGVPGVAVNFTLPAVGEGGGQTPVFADGSAPPAAKTMTVTSCAADLGASPPAACLRDGVATPGLAYAPIISAAAGEFSVSAAVDGVALGQGLVKFGPGAASPAASWFTLEPVSASGPPPAAGSGAAYRLTLTAMNGGTGDEALPVGGVCVTLDLPAGVSVADPPPPGGACPAGQYSTGPDGKVSALVRSQLAGRFQVGARIGGSPVPTEPAGSVHRRQAFFVGGPPSGAASELTSPLEPVPADGRRPQTVAVTLRDAFGNLATCWDGSKQIPCAAEVAVPAGTRAGQGGGAVEGPAVVQAPAALVDYPAAGAPVGGPAKVDFFGQAGDYQVTARVGGSDVLVADGVASPSGPARAKIGFTPVVVQLGRPSVDPSNGRRVAGRVDAADSGLAAEGGLSVAVRDPAGLVWAVCLVGADGAFECPLEPPAGDGQHLEVVVKGPAGAVSPPTRLVVDATAPPPPVVAPTEGGTVTGRGSAPGDTISVTRPDGTAACSALVRPDLSWSCVLRPPAKAGDELRLVESDRAGNTSTEVVWRVGLPRASANPARVCPGAEVTLAGAGFQPGELIQLTLPGRAEPRGSATPGPVRAGPDGAARWTWPVPADASPGQLVASLAGSKSGRVAAVFNVLTCQAPPGGATGRRTDGPSHLPFTGPNRATLTLALALAGALAAAGAALRRSRQPKPPR
jgi:hypothetical protein